MGFFSSLKKLGPAVESAEVFINSVYTKGALPNEESLAIKAQAELMGLFFLHRGDFEAYREKAKISIGEDKILQRNIITTDDEQFLRLHETFIHHYHDYKMRTFEDSSLLKAIEAAAQLSSLRPDIYDRSIVLDLNAEYISKIVNNEEYQGAIKRILLVLKSHENIKQTEFYQLMKPMPAEKVSMYLYFATVEGRINRVKEGRTYTLSTQ
jgi:hypothetical protein